MIILLVGTPNDSMNHTNPEPVRSTKIAWETRNLINCPLDSGEKGNKAMHPSVSHLTTYQRKNSSKFSNFGSARRFFGDRCRLLQLPISMLDVRSFLFEHFLTFTASSYNSIDESHAIALCNTQICKFGFNSWLEWGKRTNTNPIIKLTIHLKRSFSFLSLPPLHAAHAIPPLRIGNNV